MFPGMSSLTGGGGLSASSSSSATAGDQTGGAVSFGAFNATAPNPNSRDNNLLIIGVIIAGMAFYALSKKKR